MIRTLFPALLVAALPALATAGEGKECKAGKHDKQAKHELKKMSVDEVHARIEKKDIYIFDNNAKERFEKGHLPTAVWVPYDKVEAKDLPADKTATLLFYCANERCMACHKAADQAMDLGYKNVYIMPAGIMGWEKAEKPVEKPSSERS